MGRTLRDARNDRLWVEERAHKKRDEQAEIKRQLKEEDEDMRALDDLLSHLYESEY